MVKNSKVLNSSSSFSIVRNTHVAIVKRYSGDWNRTRDHLNRCTTNNHFIFFRLRFCDHGWITPNSWTLNGRTTSREFFPSFPTSQNCCRSRFWFCRWCCFGNFFLPVKFFCELFTIFGIVNFQSLKKNRKRSSVRPSPQTQLQEQITGPKRANLAKKGKEGWLCYGTLVEVYGALAKKRAKDNVIYPQ